MSFTLPDLDDRTFDDLLAEGLQIVNSVNSAWTNRNASDPGVTLLELFAFVTETMIFRVNQIREEDLRAFARLLSPDVDDSAGLEGNDQLRDALRRTQRLDRLVTCHDFEREALDISGVARARCVPERDLTASTSAARAAERPGHVSVLIVPHGGAPIEIDRVIERVRASLEPRRLLGTTVHVGQPDYVPVDVRLTLTVGAEASPQVVREQAVSAINRFFDPRRGGPDGNGWPMGRPIYVSELFNLVDRIPAVDFATRSFDPAKGAPADELHAEPPSRLVRNEAGELALVTLEQHEMPEVQIDPELIRIRFAEDRDGGQKR